MKQLLLLLTLAVSTAIQAQAPFQKAISLPYTQDLRPSSIYSCTDGGFLIGTSNYNNNIYGYFTSGNSEALIRTNSNGEVIWTKILQADGNSGITILQAEECNGAYIVFGEYYSLPDSSFYSSVSYFLTMISTSGNISWTKTYTIPGSAYMHPKMNQLAGGGFVVSTSQSQTMGAFKTDANGNLLWSFSYPGDTSTTYQKNPGFDCAVNGDGSMLFTGKSISNIMLVKTDVNGNIQWTKNLTDGYSYYHANSIVSTNDGGYMLAGYQNYQGFLMKLDANGNSSWYKSFSNASTFDKILKLPNGEFEVLGQDIDFNTWYPTYLSFVARFDMNGNPLSAYHLGEWNTANNYVRDICLTATGEIGLTGEEADAYNAGQAMTIFRTNAAGELPCQFAGFVLQSDNSAINPSPVSQVAIIRQNQNCDVQSPSFNFIPTMFLDNDFCTLFGTQENNIPAQSITAFPSPVAAGENFHITAEGFEGTSVISIYDANGKVVKQFNQEFFRDQSTAIEISTAGFSSGIYLVRIKGADEKILGETKFIVN